MRRFPVSFLRFLLAALLGFALAGCAVPKVTVHDDPLSDKEHLQLGMSYEKQGEYERAVEQYEEAARTIPEAWLFKGNALYAQGDKKRAEAAYEEALERLPDNPEVLNNLAWIYYERGHDLSKAEAMAMKALAITDPRNTAERSVYQDTLDKIRAARAAQGN